VPFPAITKTMNTLKVLALLVCLAATCPSAFSQAVYGSPSAAYPAVHDPSTDAFAADEPISSPGFPPLPDRLDLPVSTARDRQPAASRPHAHSAAVSAAPVVRTRDKSYDHKPYRHESVSRGRSPGYPKVVDVPLPVRPNSTPTVSATSRELQQLGAEPKLAPQREQQPAPDLTPVRIDQSVTQDLSLPEDVDQSHRTTPLNNFGRNLLHSTLQRGASQAQQLIYRGL
jgi:hypothetical protein